MELRLEYTKYYALLLSLDNQTIQSTSGTTSPLSTSHLIIAYRKLNDEVSEKEIKRKTIGDKEILIGKYTY